MSDIQRALAVIAESNPQEHQVLAAAIGKNIVSLGTDEAFALKDTEGEIRAFKQRLDLYPNKGLVQPVPGGPWVVSAQGYEMWAEAAGASVIFPQHVLVGSEYQLNPYVERDPDNKRILCVYARAIAFRFSSKGIPQVCDWTTIFDTPSYRLIDLLAKAKNQPQAFALLPADMAPDADNNGNKATWASYPFDESTRLWINTSHPEALKWYAQIINREKKSMDFAQTFARRNALKHLSGHQQAQPENGRWSIPVLCWRPMNGNIIKWDATRYAQLQHQVAGMIESGGEEFRQLPQIESHTGTERVSDEDGFDGIEAGIDPEDQDHAIDVEGTTTAKKEYGPKDFGPPQGQTARNSGEFQSGGSPWRQPARNSQPEAKAPEELSDEDRNTLANYEVSSDSFPEEFKAAVKKAGVKDPKNPTVAEAKAALQAMQDIFDNH